jgi:hypothetical protein
MAELVAGPTDVPARKMVDKPEKLKPNKRSNKDRRSGVVRRRVLNEKRNEGAERRTALVE